LEAAILFLIRSEVTASMREYIADPLSWWLRRGAKTVIFIEPGGGDESWPGGSPPDAPADPDKPLAQPSSSQR
jgi:hypothetical protein